MQDISDVSGLSTHTCHARGCTAKIPPRLLMCSKHWRQVPKSLQAEVWKHYRPGQEVDKNPTPEYLQAARNAINSVTPPEPAQPQLPDWIANRPKDRPLTGYHVDTANLVEIRHPQTKICLQDGALYLSHTVTGSFENLAGYRLATPDDFRVAKWYTTADGILFRLTHRGHTVTLIHSHCARIIRLPSTEQTEYSKAIWAFAIASEGAILDEEAASNAAH